MSTLTFAGLPVLAIIEDFQHNATGNAGPRSEKPAPTTPISQTPGRKQSSVKASDYQRVLAEEAG